MRTVLVLGAGLVSRPLVRFFLALDDYRVLAASLIAADAEKLVGGHPRGEVCQLDVAEDRALDALVARADLVISLVPFTFHTQVARAAIRHGVDVVTASYVSPEMRALDAEARRAGVTILNELGLDPGLDHMSAMRLIRVAESSGRRVTSFMSSCGVIPAPEATDNPWKYKFSWSPRGVLLAARQPARYVEGGRIVDLPAERLFSAPRPYRLDPLGTFEIYPNRDSLQYVEPYGLREPRDMLRATIRHPGWSETMRGLRALGLLEVEPRSWPAGSSYRDLLSSLLPPSREALEARVAERLGTSSEAVLERLRWAGLLSDQPLAPSPASSALVASPLDLLVELLQGRLVYAKGERDMVVMQHELASTGPGGERRHFSRLVAYGEPEGDTATARTVSLPAAVAGHLLLEGELQGPGVLIPTRPEIYEPLLERLAPAGITFEEWTEGPA